jgi:hypothetical protein
LLAFPIREEMPSPSPCWVAVFCVTMKVGEGVMR